MMDKVKAIVFFANTWSMTDEHTGIIREGLTIEYVMTDKLSPVNNNEDGSLGYRTIKESINIANANQIKKVPGIYEMTYGFTVRQGRPVMKLQEIKFVSEVI